MMLRTTKFLLLVLLVNQFLLAQAQYTDQTTQVPGVVIAHQAAASGQYIGSPSMAILPNGDYVASHDFFGPQSSEFVQAITTVYRSADKGQSWHKVSEIRGAFWSSLFVNKGELYLIGPDRHHGTVLIRKSSDGGEHWTQPTGTENGLLLKGMFHCAPVPVIEYKGRIWRAMETAHGPILEWGKRYGAMMMSAPVDADLLNAKSWTTSNFLTYDSTYLDGHFTGWLEGNAVPAPDGGIVDLLRVDDKSTLNEKAAMVQISADGKVASFDPATGFIDFPGGSKKFAVRYDEKSGRYWTLSNAIPEAVRAANEGKNPATIRNTLVLMSSEDLVHWVKHEVILQHPDVAKHGFQYVDWLFEGQDMIVASRTAYDDAEGGAHNNHDANFLTFHRIANFRTKINQHIQD